MNKNTNFRFFIESSAKNIAHVIKKSSPNVVLTQSNRKLPEHLHQRIRHIVFLIVWEPAGLDQFGHSQKLKEGEEKGA
jgi:hypothetical protein